MAAVTTAKFRERKWNDRKGRRCSAWELNFYIIEDDGRRERVFIGGFGSKRSADEHYRKVSKRIEAGKYKKNPTPVPMLNDFVETFHSEGSTGKRPRSIERDRLTTKQFIKFVGEKTRLDCVTTRHVDGFVAAQFEDGKAESTVARDLAVLRRMFNVAIRWEHLEKNPTAGIKKPRIPDGDVVYLEIHQQHALLAACSPLSSEGARATAPYLRPMIVVALHTGMRRSEILNLRWEHIDFGNKRLIVKNTPTFRTKSSKDRVLNLTPDVIRELEAWRKWFRSEIARARERAADSKLTPQLRAKASARLDTLLRCEPRPGRLVFPSFRCLDDATGEARPLDNIQTAWEEVVSRSKIGRKFGFHALRHTFAVMLARAGAPLVKISKALGHQSLSLTEKTYLRFFPDEGANVTDSLPSLRELCEPVREQTADESASAS